MISCKLDTTNNENQSNKMDTIIKIKLAFYLCFILSLDSTAQENRNVVRVMGDLTCISSNGMPAHETGKFPNRANPNKLREQNLSFCFPSVPRLTKTVTWGLTTTGVSIRGIPIRPYTAEYFDANTKRGFSKNPASGWRKQAMYLSIDLGIDTENGHVDKSGLYHYHRIGETIEKSRKPILFGFAPDGFKIVYDPMIATSSWQLKSGKRSLPVGGSYDGKFEEDFGYFSESGSLDECNGLRIRGEYTYFATINYPFFPRCFKGEVNLNFMVRN